MNIQSQEDMLKFLRQQNMTQTRLKAELARRPSLWRPYAILMDQLPK